MTKRIWVDGARARAGVVVALVGSCLLVATLAWRIDAEDADCASIVNPDRARECVASSAQTLDWELLGSMLVVTASATLIAVGGMLVVRARRPVMDVVRAATLMEIDVPGVRSLIANGDLVPIMSEGRTYVAASDVERLILDATAKRGALPEGV